MKKLILLFALIWSAMSFGQTDNFYNTDKKVSWEKIFETSKTFDQLLSSVKQSGNFSDIEVVEGRIIANFKNIVPKYREAGYTLMGTSMYLSNGIFFGNATIDFKEGKYRVIVSNIKMTYKVPTMNMSMTDQTGGLEEVALKRNSDFRTSFFSKDSKILNYTFTELFTFESTKKTADNW